jgi:hypothetical protein|tara:strand:+ start:2610 stop:2999 length:390 start_codon:yes stop_codon:yes gene_type:complete
MKGINGWLLVYLIGSVPVLSFYAAALAGWFFDYPIGLFVAILVVLAVPLVLLVLKMPSAPAWNIALVWVGAGLISLRILYPVILADEAALERILAQVTTLASFVLFAIAWAVLWTMYFRSSDRVANTFS